MKEKWEVVDNYKNYLISNQGRIFNTRLHKFMKLSRTPKGYVRIGLSKNNKRKVFLVHVLVLYHFLESRPLKKMCNHKNGIKHDNNIENLEWVTNAQNIKHAYDNKLITKHRGVIKNRGEKNGNSKINEDIVRNIKRLFRDGYTQNNISKLLNLGFSMVHAVVREHRWKYVTI